MPAAREDLFALLDKLGIAHRTREHEAAFTVEDARALRGLIPGGHTKNLFLKDKKGRLWLIVAEEDTTVDLKNLHRRIGSARLSFGKPDLMEQVLGVRPGSVTPFAVMNDAEGRVTVALDEAMMKHDILNFHPLENTATTSISSRDLLKFLAAVAHEPLIVPVS